MLLSIELGCPESFALLIDRDDCIAAEHTIRLVSRDLHCDEYLEDVRQGFADYRGTLPEERRVLLDRFEIKDTAIKVVGVGSVGTFVG